MKNTPFNFKCKFCNQPVTITEEDYIFDDIDIQHKTNFKTLEYGCEIIYCPNPTCKKIHIYQHIKKTSYTPPMGKGGIYFPGKKSVESKTLQVVPESDSIL